RKLLVYISAFHACSIQRTGSSRLRFFTPPTQRRFHEPQSEMVARRDVAGGGERRPGNADQRGGRSREGVRLEVQLLRRPGDPPVPLFHLLRQPLLGLRRRRV